MHLTLKKEATKPAARNFLQQQARVDDFVEVFNHQRPHEALDMKMSGRGLPTFPTSLHRIARPRLSFPRQNHRGHPLRSHLFGEQKDQFQPGFAGQAVGIKEVHDDIWLVSFMDYDLGYFDLETRVLEPLENPFGPKVSPM